MRANSDIQKRDSQGFSVMLAWSTGLSLLVCLWLPPMVAQHHIVNPNSAPPRVWIVQAGSVRCTCCNPSRGMRWGQIPLVTGVQWLEVGPKNCVAVREG